ncbi:hypothetical protein BV25DRAFT_1290214 [Artomyces pyxidatus]|uniref:Uncharacterized protein n=1 Tax=Artomyces pyxidatus TaxID=48021 RepID=A0ACB8SPT2_9AGAM|nr:hypothetical protein BV25DRAFT_1290214 [Artomyces pyxidatus]
MLSSKPSSLTSVFCAPRPSSTMLLCQLLALLCGAVALLYPAIPSAIELGQDILDQIFPPQYNPTVTYIYMTGADNAPPKSLRRGITTANYPTAYATSSVYPIDAAPVAPSHRLSVALVCACLLFAAVLGRWLVSYQVRGKASSLSSLTAVKSGLRDHSETSSPANFTTSVPCGRPKVSMSSIYPPSPPSSPTSAIHLLPPPDKSSNITPAELRRRLRLRLSLESHSQPPAGAATLTHASEIDPISSQTTSMPPFEENQAPSLTLVPSDPAAWLSFVFCNDDDTEKFVYTSHDEDDEDDDEQFVYTGEDAAPPHTIDEDAESDELGIPATASRSDLHAGKTEPLPLLTLSPLSSMTPVAQSGNIILLQSVRNGRPAGLEASIHAPR